MTQAIWKGVVSFGEIAVPVKLHAAARDQDIHFHLLHDADATRVQQRIVHPQTGESVPKEQIRRGYAVAPNQLVVLTEEELSALTPQASRAIEITRFVPQSALPPRWFERPYFLAPDGLGAAYSALVEALRASGRQGIARWVMRKKHYIGVLRVHRAALVLVTLRFAGEVLDASKLEVPAARAPDAREVQLAEGLLKALAGDFDPSAFHSEHRARVLELIARKAKGGVVELKAWRTKRAKAESLTAALQASLKQTRSKRKERAHG
jgi:DNA end-binding protein Ku